MKWEEKIRRVVPYVPGEQPVGERLVKLNTNECPYPPSPKVIEALKDIKADSLRLYPDPEVGDLRQALADYYGVKKEQVFVGVGSDDVLANAFLTFFNGDSPILFPDITYSFYDVWAELFGIPYERIALSQDFRIRPQDYNRENGGVIFPNPNAPTGVFEDLSLVRQILDANRDVVVIVDEAYVDFGGESALPLLQEYDNLLVVQTFSKSRALAGARIGFAIGNEKLIGYLNDVKFSFNSYTMSRPTIAMGVACVKDDEWFQDTVKKVVKTRERVKKELLQLGFSFPDSKSNFIFAAHECIPAKELFEACRKEQIYVRYFAKDRIDNYLRISIGTDEEMDILLKFLQNYIRRNERKI
ncbi:MAG: histidinol-phosphate transaminase [Lachnospiraceae bacterium]|nr:histidinol-phosphate transaminase [Lachnospiraceae bacterium]MDY5701547.1 histidinol-phosphate transaminase [Lachnospiraceae bacterium]